MLSKYRVLFKNWEKLAFYAVTIIFVTQFSFNQTVLTYDGPSHVYNAGIIKEKIFSGLPIYDIFQFNNTPNWSTHVILAFFQMFLNPDISERLFLFILVILFAYSFRNLLLSWFPKAWHMTWLSSLFAFNFLFYFGFYNFIFGIITGFLLLIKHHKKRQSTGLLFLKYTLLWLILAFTHAFVFLLIAGIAFWEFALGLFARYTRYVNPIEDKNSATNDTSFLFDIRLSSVRLISAVLPSFIILIYIFKPLENQVFLFLSFEEILALFQSVRPFVVFNSEIENKYLVPLFSLILAFSLVFLIRSIWKEQGRIFHINHSLFRFIFWFPIFSGSLFLAFQVPDSDAYVGFVSLRMVFIVFIFGSIFISIIRFPVWAKLILVCYITFCTNKLQNYRTSQLNYLQPYVFSLKEAGKLIGSETYTLLYTLENNWFLRHAGMLAFHNNHSVSLDNYEAEYPFFPISWNVGMLPDLRIGTISSGELPCFKWESNKIQPHKKVDYVLLFGREDQITDSCELAMWEHVKQQYTLIYSDEHVVLMALKRKSF